MSPERVDVTPNNGKPGAILAREREVQGLSIEQVADQLKLAPRQIVALEKDDFASLPGMAVVRGFVRAYAKHLRLDAAPLVAMITVESGLGESSAMRREMATPFSETRMPSMNRRSMTPLWVGGSVLMLCIIIALSYMQLAGKWPTSLNNLSKVENTDDAAVQPSASAELGSDTNATVSAPGAGVATTDVASANAGVPVSSLPAPIVETANAPANSGVPTTPNVSPSPVSNTVGAVNPNNAIAAPAESNSLVLNLKQDSWIEVKRSNGQVLISRLLKAGSAETIDMSSPILLVVGNVNGVEANLRGTSLNLKSGTGNTARLNLK